MIETLVRQNFLLPQLHKVSKNNLLKNIRIQKHVNTTYEVCEGGIILCNSYCNSYFNTIACIGIIIIVKVVSYYSVWRWYISYCSSSDDIELPHG